MVCYDIIIAGAGPGGLSAGLRANELKLSCLILEGKRIGNTILETYPSGKEVTDFPKDMGIKGDFWFERCKVRELVDKWDGIGKELGVREGEEVVEVKKEGEIFSVKTNKDRYKGKFVVMAIGKEGKPRRLGVRGEELRKVFYKLKGKEGIEGKNILIIGGGDSAIDAALILCEKNNVTLSYRKEAFFRLNEENAKKIKEKRKKRKIKVIFKSNIKEIRVKNVVLEVDGKEKEINNDAVFIFTGAELPIDFLKGIGVEVDEGRVVLNENFQSSIDGLYIIGDAAGKPPYLIKPAINQGYDVVNVISSNF